MLFEYFLKDIHSTELSIPDKMWDENGESVQLLSAVIDFVSELNRKSGKADTIRAHTLSWCNQVGLAIFNLFNKKRPIEKEGLVSQQQVYPLYGGSIAKYLRYQLGYTLPIGFTDSKDWQALKNTLLGGNPYTLCDGDALKALIRIDTLQGKTYIKKHAHLLKRLVFNEKTWPALTSEFLKVNYRDEIIKLIDIAFEIVAIASTPLAFNDLDAQYSKELYKAALETYEREQDKRERARNQIIYDDFYQHHPKPFDATEQLIWEIQSLHYLVDCKEKYSQKQADFIDTPLAHALTEFDKTHAKPKITNIEVDNLTKLSYLAPGLYETLEAIIKKRAKKADTAPLRRKEKIIRAHFSKVMNQFKASIAEVTHRQIVKARAQIQKATEKILFLLTQPTPIAKDRLNQIQSRLIAIELSYNRLIKLCKPKEEKSLRQEKSNTLNALKNAINIYGKQKNGQPRLKAHTSLSL